MRKILLIILVLSSLSSAQTNYCTKISNEKIIQKQYLTISYSCTDKIPNYVGYYITKNTIAGPAKRESIFYCDQILELRFQAKSSDYTNSGYDRGHMSPAADWKINRQAMHDSFSILNICPQRPQLNRRYWESVEELERKMTSRCDMLYIISGSICRNPIYINGHVRVPDRFYKTIIGIKGNNVIISIGWIFENTNNVQKQENHQYTIDEVERTIGLDLYQGFWFNEMKENVKLK